MFLPSQNILGKNVLELLIGSADSFQNEIYFTSVLTQWAQAIICFLCAGFWYTKSDKNIHSAI